MILQFLQLAIALKHKNIVQLCICEQILTPHTLCLKLEKQ